MRFIIAVLLLLLPGLAWSQNMPIRRGILQTDMNGNGMAITNVIISGPFGSFSFGQFHTVYTTNLVIANLASSNQVVYVDGLGQLWATTGTNDGDILVRVNGTPTWTNSATFDIFSLTEPIPMSIGGSGSVLLDPNTNSVWMWDDAQGSNRFATIGPGLGYSGGVLSSTAAAGATNAIATVKTNGVNVGIGATTIDFVNGANTTISGTMAGTDVAITITSSGGTASVFTNVARIYVATNGNDTTAVVGNDNLPFLTLTNANQAALAMYPRPARIILGEGRFDISTNLFIWLTNRTVLEGQGANTEIYSTNFVSGGTLNMLVTSDNVEIKNLKLISVPPVGSSCTNVTVPILVYGSSNVVVRNVQIIGESDGIIVDQATATQIPSLFVYDSHIDTSWDCIFQKAAAGTTAIRTNIYVEINNTALWSRRGGYNCGPATSSAGLSTFGYGTVVMNGGTIIVTSHPTNNLGAFVKTTGEGRMFLNHVGFYVTNGLAAKNAYPNVFVQLNDCYNLHGGVINLVGETNIYMTPQTITAAVPGALYSSPDGKKMELTVSPIVASVTLTNADGSHGVFLSSGADIFQFYDLDVPARPINFSSSGVSIQHDTGLFALGAASDVLMSWEGTGILQLGQDSVSPPDYTFKAGDGTGVNQEGADLTIAPGRAIGNGVPGVLRFATGGTNASGVAIGALTNRIIIDGGDATVTIPGKILTGSSLTFSNADTTTYFATNRGGNVLRFVQPGSANHVELSSSGMAVGFDVGIIGFGVNSDSIIAWDGAGGLQLGQDTTSPVDYIFSAADATAVNNSGADLKIAGGSAMGNGAPGLLILATAGTNASGATVGTLTNRVVIHGGQGAVTISNLLSATTNIVGANTDGTLRPITIGANLSLAGDGTLSSSGSGGSGGAGTNSMFEYSISNAAAIGATSVALDRNFVPPATIAGHIAIGFGTTNCEIRPAKGVSANSVNWDRGLTFTHAANEKVIWFAGDAYCAFWGMKGDYSVGNGTDNSFAMLQALYDTSQEGIRLVGNGTFGISMPMVLGESAQMADILVSALNTYTANENTNSWFFINQEAGRIAFSVFGTNTITTIAAGDWPAVPTNMMVIPYGIGGTNLPTGLTNGIPVFVKAWGADWLRVGLTVSATNEITLGTGTGFLYTEIGGQHKVYLDNVTLDGGSRTNMNGLYACMQQPAEFNYLRLNHFYGTALRFPTGTQQVDVNNLEIIDCGIGLDTRGATFVYIKALNIEHYTNALVGGAHIWGMHIEQCDAISGVSIDLTREASVDLMIDGFSATQTLPPHTYFLLSDSDTRSAVDLRRLTLGGAINSGMIAISDPRCGPDIHVWNETNGLSCANYIAKYQHGVIPETSQHKNEFGGFSWPGGDGRLVQFGGEFADIPTLRLRAMTNQTGDILQILRSNGTTNSGIDAYGNFYVRSNATAGYVMTSDANGKLYLGAAGAGGSQTPWLQDIDGGGFTLTNAILGTAVQPIEDFYPKFIRGNPYGDLITFTNLPLNPNQFSGFNTTNHSIKSGALLTNILSYATSGPPAIGLRGHASSANTFTITNGPGTEVLTVGYNGELNIHGAASGATISQTMMQVTSIASNTVAARFRPADTATYGNYNTNVIETYTTNGATIGFSVDGVGKATAVSFATTGSGANGMDALIVTNALASYSTTASVSIAASGWTNIFSPVQNATVYINAAAADLAFYVKNNAGTPVFTNANSAGVVATVFLQPGGAVVITGGTTPTGRATPF